MSGAWICSRRKAEEYIRDGQVLVNGEIAKIWQSVNPDSDIVTLGKWAKMSQQDFVYYKYNKARGVETTCAQREGNSIIDIIDVPERVFPVWRLDKESTGLIILTNDGRMTNYLTHPSFWHEKEYVVETFGAIGDSELEEMWRWVMVLGSRTKECRIERLAAGKFSIILTEWKNRQIRRMVEEVWSKVKKLKRIRIETINIDGLMEGQIKRLSHKEKNQLFKQIGLAV